MEGLVDHVGPIVIAHECRMACSAPGRAHFVLSLQCALRPPRAGRMMPVSTLAVLRHHWKYYLAPFVRGNDHEGYPQFLKILLDPQVDIHLFLSRDLRRETICP